MYAVVIHVSRHRNLDRIFGFVELELLQLFKGNGSLIDTECQKLTTRSLVHNYKNNSKIKQRID